MSIRWRGSKKKIKKNLTTVGKCVSDGVGEMYSNFLQLILDIPHFLFCLYICKRVLFVYQAA